MKIAFLILQTILAILVIVSILMQSKGSGLGSIFGGSGGTYSTRRGVEKVVFYLTVVLAVLFFISSLIQLLIV